MKIFLNIISFSIGILVFIAELYLIFSLWGVVGVILGVFLFPLLLFIMPFYALYSYGNWYLLALSMLSLVIQLCIKDK